MNPKHSLFVLFLLAALVTAAVADPGPDQRLVFNSPISPLLCTVANSLAVPGRNYIYETYQIAWQIRDEGRRGWCWFIGDGQTPAATVDQFCAMVWWADPGAACWPGPAPVGAMAIVYEVRLPLIFKRR